MAAFKRPGALGSRFPILSPKHAARLDREKQPRGPGSQGVSPGGRLDGRGSGRTISRDGRHGPHSGQALKDEPATLRATPGSPLTAFPPCGEHQLGRPARSGWGALVAILETKTKPF
jgi:hypothetical protein